MTLNPNPNKRLQREIESLKATAEANLADFREDCECRVSQEREVRLAAEHMCELLAYQLKALGANCSELSSSPGSPTTVVAAKAVAKGGWRGASWGEWWWGCWCWR